MEVFKDTKDSIATTQENDFTEYIVKYHQKIHKYCYHLLRNRQDAEDATQEVFLKAYKSFHKVHSQSTLSPWFYTIAYRHCLNVLKRKKLIRSIPYQTDIKLLPEEEYINSELEFNEEISYLLRKLTSKERAIVTMKVINEFPYSEISTIVNSSQSAVRKCYERAIKKLKKHTTTNEMGCVKDEKISIN
ncbi:RNA polymerase sigma factor [Cytobacillus sp. IB215316]|uniref:RNA polymerase sigma factor n=1 Tax=Cytobacillus sp. IB215316 TaxID=3097354 RepID=UPI002A13DEAA|nr:RNA polymerase sigma factor [Cytobacillus sp. IB215316]MDX8360409.1 RNA polymerase sigma factor [Cytobacillus sp. IB215316]